MFSLRGWKHIDDDEGKPLVEVTPNSRVAYNEGKAVYIFSRSLMNMGCTVSSQPCSISCGIVDGFFPHCETRGWYLLRVPLLCLSIQIYTLVLLAHTELFRRSRGPKFDTRLCHKTILLYRHLILCRLLFHQTSTFFILYHFKNKSQHQIKRMADYIKESHTTIFTGPTKCGKTHLVLDLIEKEYNEHFDYIIIICLTLQYNKTCHSRDWIKNDDRVWFIEPPKYVIRRTLQDNKAVSEKVSGLYYWIEKLQQLLACSEVVFIIDDIITDERLDKRRQSLLALAISGRHREHYLWLLTQSYSAIPKNIRRQAMAIFVQYPKEKEDLKKVHDENDVLTDDELVVARDFLKNSKCA